MSLDEIPTNVGGEAEEVLKHLVVDGFPDCINANNAKMQVVTDDEGMPKFLGGISFGDGSQLIAFSFAEINNRRMEEAGSRE